YSSSGRELTVILPLPERRKTRAMAFLRRPVPKLRLFSTVAISNFPWLRLLRGVLVLRAGVHLELFKHRPAERVLRQHAAHGAFDDPFGRLVELLLERQRFHVADVTGVMIVIFVGALVAGHVHLFGVDHDDVV